MTVLERRRRKQFQKIEGLTRLFREGADVYLRCPPDRPDMAERMELHLRALAQVVSNAHDQFGECRDDEQARLDAIMLDLDLQMFELGGMQ